MINIKIKEIKSKASGFKPAYIYLALFLILIVFIGTVSTVNIIRFYVKDEVDYNEWNADLGSKFETDIATTFFNKFQFINLNGAFRNLLGQKEMNGVVKLDNGYLTTIIDYTDDETLQEYADNVSYFNKYLEDNGIKLVYILTPYTVDKYDEKLPEGVMDYGNDNADRLVSKLEDAGIDTIDIRDTMHEDGVNHYEMMFKTDHHWTMEAGLYAYGKIEEYINAVTGCEVDNRISDISNYYIETYEQWHLGSRGQRTGRYYAGTDDFELILPKFDVTVTNEDGMSGKMQDIAIDKRSLKSRKYMSRYTYDNTLSKSFGHYKNPDACNDTKITIISDSFANAVNPYLIMGFSEVDSIYDNDVSVVTKEYIEKYNPDVVVMMYYAEVATTYPGAYEFSEYKIMQDIP